MTKSELISVLNNKSPDLDLHTIESAVNCMLMHISTALVERNRIEVRDFGSFNLHLRTARLARNPKTGESVSLPSKTAVHFKPGLQLRNRVDASRSQSDIVE